MLYNKIHFFTKSKVILFILRHTIYNTLYTFLPPAALLAWRQPKRLLFTFSTFLITHGTEWPILCWCAVKQLLTHSLFVWLYRPKAIYCNYHVLSIIAVFLEYLRQFLIDLQQTYRHSSVPQNTYLWIFELLSSSGFRARRRRDFFHGVPATV